MPTAPLNVAALGNTVHLRASGAQRAVTGRLVAQVADTPQGRAELAVRAGMDGTPSVVVDLGESVALVAGEALRTSTSRTPSGGARVSQGSFVEFNGQVGQAVSVDDGLDEVNARNVIVAVVDTGVDVNHPALAGRVLPGYNSANGTSDVSDRHGHGTHVAGLVAGGTTGQAAAVGVANSARILPIKACDDNGRFTDATIAAGVWAAVQRGAKVVNLSLQDSEGMPLTEQAIQAATAAGVLVVVASGNQGAGSMSNPAKTPGVLAVGSAKNGQRSSFSNGGQGIGLVADGQDAYSLLPGAQYGNKSGTSMAAPRVAGAAALVIAQHPNWTPAQIIQHLMGTAQDAGQAGYDLAYGAGEMDAQAAVFGNRPTQQATGAPIYGQAPSYGYPTQPQVPGYGYPTQPQAPSYGYPTQPQAPGYGYPTQPQAPAYPGYPAPQPSYPAPQPSYPPQPSPAPNYGYPGYGAPQAPSNPWTLPEFPVAPDAGAYRPTQPDGYGAYPPGYAMPGRYQAPGQEGFLGRLARWLGLRG